jgi:hypothetical protein
MASFSTPEIMADLNSVFTPHKGQIPVGNELFYKHRERVFVKCGRKWGKCLKSLSFIRTPNGVKRLKDVKLGDTLIDMHGMETRVTYVSPLYTQNKTYRVKFNDRTELIADEHHRWWVEGNGYKRKVLTTKDLLNKKHMNRVPLCEPVQYSAKAQIVEPYVLGLWLGDGKSSCGEFTTADEDIISSIKSFGYDVTTLNDRYHYYIKGLMTKLRKIGVLNNKHIPDNYLFGSVEQRTELLMGLMDSDGWVSEDFGKTFFCQKNIVLFNNVVDLFRSLGQRVTVCKEKIINGEVYNCLYCPANIQVFKLKRKANRLEGHFDRGNRKFKLIQGIEEVEKAEVMCISVDSPSESYLTEDYTVTHNTTFCVYSLYRWAMLNPINGCYYIAPFLNQAKELIWADKRLQTFFPDPLIDKYQITFNNTELRVRFGFNNSFIKADGADNIENRRGINPHFVVADELKDIKKGFWEGFEPNLAAHSAPLLGVGTPPDNTDNMFTLMEEECKREDNAAFFNMPSSVNPHVSPEFLERTRARLIERGEEDVWQREYLAQTVLGGSKSIFPMLDEVKHVLPYDEMLKTIRRQRKQWEFFISFDPGTSTCFAALLVAVNKYDKRIFVMDEIYETEASKTVSRYIWKLAEEKWRAVHPLDDDWYKLYDYAAAWFAAEIANEFDEAVNPCTKDMKKKENRLSVIKDALLRGYYYMSDRCRKHFWEMQNYRKDDNGKILKENDHTIDNIRYILNAAHYSQVPEQEYVLVSDYRGFRFDNDIYEPNDSDRLEQFLGGDDGLDYDSLYY